MTQFHKALRRALALLLSLLLLVAAFCGCSSSGKTEKSIERRIDAFLDAYNDGDLEKALESLDTEARTMMQALLTIMGFAGDLSGVDVDLSELFEIGVGGSGDDALLEYEITAINILDEENAVVSGTMSYDDEDMGAAYFVMVYENGGWYINDFTERKPAGAEDANSNTDTGSIETNESGESVVAYEITEFGDFSNGIAQISYQKDSITYKGLINTNINLIYRSSAIFFSWEYLGNNTICVTESDSQASGSPKKHTLLSTTGKIVKVFTNEDFDRIAAVGDGKMLVYKYTSSITSVEHKYGIITSDGAWLTPLSQWTSDGSSVLSDHYLGQGLFALQLASGDDYVLYSTSHASFYYLFNAYLGSLSAYNYSIKRQFSANDPIYCESGYGGTYISINDKKQSLPSYFLLYPDGSFKEITKSEYTLKAQICIKDGDYYKFYFPSSGNAVTYTDYPASMISSVSKADDMLFLKLRGADGNTYFTLIGSSGKTLFEPIMYQNQCSYSDRTVVYWAEYKYQVVDTNGSTLIPADNGYSSIGNFNSGIAVARERHEKTSTTYSTINFYINKNGEKLPSKVTEEFLDSAD